MFLRNADVDVPYELICGLLKSIFIDIRAAKSQLQTIMVEVQMVEFGRDGISKKRADTIIQKIWEEMNMPMREGADLERSHSAL